MCQSCVLSLCLFNFYAEYIMRNARLDEAQAGIKTAGRNNNNLKYGDDTTLMEKEMATHSSLLAGESQVWGSLVGCRLWGCTESDMTEVT